MFQTSYVNLQEDYAVHALYMYRAHPSTRQTACIIAWKTYRIRLHVQYSLLEDENKLFETCRRQAELN